MTSILNWIPTILQTLFLLLCAYMISFSSTHNFMAQVLLVFDL